MTSRGSLCLILTLLMVGSFFTVVSDVQAWDWCGGAAFGNPDECLDDSDCVGGGVCSDKQCKCGADIENKPFCTDRCGDLPLPCANDGSPCGGHSNQVNGGTIHITDCRGIDRGNQDGVISYCDNTGSGTVCVSNQGNSCVPGTNSCGMPGSGTIDCGGSCSGSVPAESLCGNQPVGSFDVADCTSAWGWSFDPDYNGSVQMHIYADGAYVDQVTTNFSRPAVDVWAQIFGYSPPNRTNSGWVWPIPISLKDGGAHTLLAYAINVDAAGSPQGPSSPLGEFPPSPKVITCSGTPPTGVLSTATCTNATGSATDAQGSPVSVAIYDGQASAGGVQIGTGPAGPNFTINYPPFTDGQMHNIYAYAQDIPSGTSYQLTGSVPVTCGPTVTLVANPTTVPFGGASTLTWSVKNATNCTATPASGWYNPATLVNGAADSSGGTGPLVANTTYTLTCTNALGQSQVATAVVAVDIPPPTGTITGVTDTDYCAVGPGMNISWLYGGSARPIGAYRLQVLDQGGGVVFGTGHVPYSQPTGTVVTSQGQPGTIGFSTAYTTRVKVWDIDGRESLWSAPFAYSTKPGPWPKAAFTYLPAKPVAKQPVQFTDTTLNSPISWLWDFGDGGTDTTQNPAYSFQAQGTYTVTLQATNAAGTCSVTQTLGATKPIPTYREVRPGQQPAQSPAQ